MKRIIFLALILFSACGSGQASVLDATEEVKGGGTILIVGEGGPSGSLFVKSAETYKREKGGEIYIVHDGTEFLGAMRDFVDEFGEIEHMEYFGHGNHVGLFVNQEPGVNASIYANDPDQNAGYRAASIYELPSDIFAKRGWIQFNGCNVANESEVHISLAQKFADYFSVDVVAPTGPTEFSLHPDVDGDVYMIATYDEHGFVRVSPNALAVKSRFVDLRKGQSFTEAVLGLEGMGFDFAGRESDRFNEYENVTYAEAVTYCKFASPNDSECFADGYLWDQRVRNLQVLRMLVDAHDVELRWTDPWVDSYLWWANNMELLTENFTSKKWYTRGELAELTWNFTQLQ